jgi:hypothetical protein
MPPLFFRGAYNLTISQLHTGGPCFLRSTLLPPCFCVRFSKCFSCKFPCYMETLIAVTNESTEDILRIHHYVSLDNYNNSRINCYVSGVCGRVVIMLAAAGIWTIRIGMYLSFYKSPSRSCACSIFWHVH